MKIYLLTCNRLEQKIFFFLTFCECVRALRISVSALFKSLSLDVTDEGESIIVWFNFWGLMAQHYGLLLQFLQMVGIQKFSDGMSICTCSNVWCSKVWWVTSYRCACDNYCFFWIFSIRVGIVMGGVFKPSCFFSFWMMCWMQLWGVPLYQEKGLLNLKMLYLCLKGLLIQESYQLGKLSSLKMNLSLHLIQELFQFFFSLTSDVCWCWFCCKWKWGWIPAAEVDGWFSLL